MKASRIFGLVTVIAVAMVIIINGPLLLGQNGVTPNQLPAQASQVSSSGLRLDFSLNATVVSVGQPLQIRVDSYNPSDGPLNVTASEAWALEGLRSGSCYSSVLPFGVAVYQGSYNAANVAQGKPLEIFPNVVCPLFIRLVTGYYFLPDSSNATILPGTGSPISISTSISVSGTYSGLGGSPQPLPAGTYTVVAGDEWGTLVFLKFEAK